ncbi:YpoC family protein [Bacillus sp. FJAT-50079]|uniref:YpoC family protein n=1 Tax=Bacillus sp. FJAT-50079 TaxID=2833577 RepID=UPI0032D5906F
MCKHSAIPTELDHPLFAHKTEQYFPYEMKYYSGLDEDKFLPWNDPDKSVKDIMIEWTSAERTLQAQFQARRQVSEAEMKKIIAHYLSLLFWTNHQPVQLNQLHKKIKLLQITPYNLPDRLDFILNRPFSYQAFKQLQELMLEQQKHYAAIKVRGRSKTPSNERNWSVN